MSKPTFSIIMMLALIIVSGLPVQSLAHDQAHPSRIAHGAGPTHLQAANKGQAYDTYSNARYHYSVSYPAGVLLPQGEADNGDGQSFLSKDGKASMMVFGSHNLDGNLADAYQAAQVDKTDENAKRVVTYKVLRGNWFVVSGHEGRKIFYQKTILRGSVFKTLIIEYDESQKAIFDSITERIVKSFTG